MKIALAILTALTLCTATMAADQPPVSSPSQVKQGMSVSQLPKGFVLRSKQAGLLVYESSETKGATAGMKKIWTVEAKNGRVVTVKRFIAPAGPKATPSK